MPKEITIAEVYRDLKISSKKMSKLHKAMKEDFEFTLGKQWDDNDRTELENAGVLPLTINQIKPMVKIVTGIERQSRSDYTAFPEGDEDELTSEIVTKLVKNIVKTSSVDRRFSEQFKEGMIGGLCYIEPYIDYTYDLINGKMKFRKVSCDRIFYNDGEEYSLSDRPFIIKMTYSLSKDDLLEMFPDSEKKFEGIKFSKIDLDKIDTITSENINEDYPIKSDNSTDSEIEEEGFDLIEYYYKSPKDVFYIADKQSGKITSANTKEEAESILQQTISNARSQGAIVDAEQFVIIKKKVPEIRLKQVVGEVELSDDVAWSYPGYKFYPIFPFYAERMTVDIDDDTLLVQGITRSLKDLQVELNLTRTSEMRHIKSTANSGWVFPEGAIDSKTKAAFKKFGSSPGFVGEYDPDKTGGTINPETFRIRPAPLPQGHMALSQERASEIRQTSGINPDLLANDSSGDSGRAILLKQRQGLVMIQEALDNYAETKQLVGRFILSQLGEVYTVESAIKVLGEAYLRENFSRPVITDAGEIARDEQGNVIEDVNQKELVLVINKILNDSEVGRFDVTIGEGQYSETIKYANYLMLLDMIEKGIPIPPDVIISESLLDEGQKKKILGAIQAAQQQAGVV